MDRDIPSSILAVDFGGTKMLLGEITPEGNILRSKLYPSDTSSQEAAMKQIIQAVEDYIHTVSFVAKRQLGIGIAVVGRVDQKRGIWHEIEPGKSQLTDVKAIMESQFRLPCGVDNDVACATRSEQRFGWGTESDHFIYLNVGTGIAAGFVTNGRYVKGSHFNAGEIGHTVVASDSDVLCGCGRMGCVERIASGLGMHERVMALHQRYPGSSIKIKEGERVAAQTILQAAEAGDKLGLAVSEAAAVALSSLIMNLVRVSDPDTIVIGGGLAGSTYLWNRVKQHLNSRTMRFVSNGIVTTKQESPDASLIGAALVGLEAWETNAKRDEV